MRFTLHAPACYPAKGVLTYRTLIGRTLIGRILTGRILTGLTVCTLVSGCGMAPGYNSMTTASLRPQPSERMVQRPYSPYGPAATLGAPMASTHISRTASAPAPVGNAGPPRTFKTYQYKWNGNQHRIQAGKALKPATVAQSNPHQLASATTAWKPTATEPVSKMTWKASPAAPATATPKSGASARHAMAHSTAGREIVVGPGDTLYSLATKHDVAMASLMQVNHLSSPVIKVSQHLVLPAASQ